ncbi:hypothetical protein HDK64DRAFT_6505 [Phyllosticta capitalensis]
MFAMLLIGGAKLRYFLASALAAQALPSGALSSPTKARSLTTADSKFIRTPHRPSISVPSRLLSTHLVRESYETASHRVHRKHASYSSLYISSRESECFAQTSWTIYSPDLAFGLLKGTAYKTARTASASVALQIVSRPQNKDTLNNLPPPSAEVPN